MTILTLPEGYSVKGGFPFQKHCQMLKKEKFRLVASAVVWGWGFVVFEPLVAFSSIRQEQPPLARHSLTATGHCPVAGKFAPNLFEFGYWLRSVLGSTICLTGEDLTKVISEGEVE